MVFKEKVLQLLAEVFEEKPELFLIDVSVSDSYKIIVTLDGDNGVLLQDCIDVSRKLENNLDREEQDYALEVASAGATSPLKHNRQYKKNKGRTLKVKTADLVFEGVLTEANDDTIILSWEAREPKKIGKGKETVKKSVEIKYTDIKEANVIIIF